MTYESVVENEGTIGKRLKDLYLHKVDHDKLNSLKKKASDILTELEKDIENNIISGKEPIATYSSVKGKLGIVAKDIEREKLLSDFIFSIVLKDLANERDLIVDIQQRPYIEGSQMANTQQPQVMMELILVCTFK